MVDKKRYKDMNKYYAHKRRCQENWRARTGSGKYSPRRWTEAEDEMVLAHEVSDRELSKMIKRSVTAIYTRRTRLGGM